jgi:hypothetical protein
VTCAGCQAARGRPAATATTRAVACHPGDGDVQRPGRRLRRPDRRGQPGGGPPAAPASRRLRRGTRPASRDADLRAQRGALAEVCTGGLDEDCDGAVDAPTRTARRCARRRWRRLRDLRRLPGGAGKTCGDCDDTAWRAPGRRRRATTGTTTATARPTRQPGGVPPAAPAAGSAPRGPTCRRDLPACATWPSAEVCTGGLDEDCDGAVDAATRTARRCADGDGDGYVTCSGCQAGREDLRRLRRHPVGVHPGGRDVQQPGRRLRRPDRRRQPGGGAACSTGQLAAAPRGPRPASRERWPACGTGPTRRGLHGRARRGLRRRRGCRRHQLHAAVPGRRWRRLRHLRRLPGGAGKTAATATTPGGRAPRAPRRATTGTTTATARPTGNPAGVRCSTGQQGCAAGTRPASRDADLLRTAPRRGLHGRLDEDCDGAVDAADTNCTPNCATPTGITTRCAARLQAPRDHLRRLRRRAPGVHPGVVEACNNRDDNCDGQTGRRKPRRRRRLHHGPAGCVRRGHAHVRGRRSGLRAEPAPSAEVCTGGARRGLRRQADTADADCLPDCADGDGTAMWPAPGAGCRRGRPAATATTARPTSTPGGGGLQQPRTTTATARTTKGPAGGERLPHRAARALLGGDAGLRGQRARLPAQRSRRPGGLRGRPRRGLRRLHATPTIPTARRCARTRTSDFYAVCTGKLPGPAGPAVRRLRRHRAFRASRALETCNNRDDDCSGGSDDGDPGGGVRVLHRGARRLRRRAPATA